MQHLIGGLLTAMLVAGAASGAEPVHLIYLHGRIIQDQQSPRPKHPEHGYYELAEITAALRDRGFLVTAEIRAKETSVSEGADAVVEQVRRLLRSGVPAERIAVVGASMGAAIALRTAARLREPYVRFALLGPCLSVNVPAIAAEESAHPTGRLLAIREESDIASAHCPSWSEENGPAALRVREVVIDTGLGHGFLYRPIPEWLDPVAEWASAQP